MTRTEANIALAAIVGALAETSAGTAPAGIVYAALSASPLGYSLADFQNLVDLLQTSGILVRDGGDVLRLTTKGRTLALQIDAHDRRSA